MVTLEPLILIPTPNLQKKKIGIDIESIPIPESESPILVPMLLLSAVFDNPK